MTAATVTPIKLPFDSSITQATIFSAYGTTVTVATASAFSSANPVTDVAAPTYNKCPITTCTITLGDCPATAALSTWSESSYLTIMDTGTTIASAAVPFPLVLAQTAAAGYAEQSFCYTCSNYQQTDAASTVKVSQMKDCSKIYDAVSPLFKFDASTAAPPHTNRYILAAGVTFDDSAAYFDLTDWDVQAKYIDVLEAADCGPLTCVPLPSGCTGTYTGNVVIGALGAMSMKQSIPAGYKETFCVSCTNTGNTLTSHSNIATLTFDNAVAWQKMNCALQFTDPPYLSPFAASPATKTNTIDFDSAGGSKVVVTKPDDIFKINYGDDCIPGGLSDFAAGCTIMDVGCAAAPASAGNIALTASITTGWLTAA